jgi:hypothetical protein
MLTIPNPNRAKRLTRFASRVCLTVGIISLVVGVAYVASGTPGGWVNTLWGGILIWQGWSLAGHGPEVTRFIATRLIPGLFFLLGAVITGSRAVRSFSQGRASLGTVFLLATLLSLVLVALGPWLTVHARPRVKSTREATSSGS